MRCCWCFLLVCSKTFFEFLFDSDSFNYGGILWWIFVCFHIWRARELDVLSCVFVLGSRAMHFVLPQRKFTPRPIMMAHVPICFGLHSGGRLHAIRHTATTHTAYKHPILKYHRGMATTTTTTIFLHFVACVCVWFVFYFFSSYSHSFSIVVVVVVVISIL